MHIEDLDILNIRNIARARFNGLAEINLIHGQNGSGKTSVLEAIYFLSMTRSFRSRKIKTIIKDGAQDVVVRGRVTSPARNSPGSDSDSVAQMFDLGVRRDLDNKALVKLRGERIHSFGQLAGVLPVQLINPDSFKLLEGGPAERRHFLDWSMFHVEQSGFFEEWSRYRKALSQRNTLLRRGKIAADVLRPWTIELARTGQRLHEIRQQAFDAMLPLFSEVCEKLSTGDSDTEHDFPGVALSYYPGWDVGRQPSLLMALTEGEELDCQRGFTRAGPHRADIRLKVEQHEAAERLSRGQIKTVVCSLKIAQVRWLSERHGIDSIFLIDDLAAELDIPRRIALLGEICGTNSQVFASSIQAEELDAGWFPEKVVKRFHVEHGNITPYSSGGNC